MSEQKRDECLPGWRHDVPMRCPCYEDYGDPQAPWLPIRRLWRWLRSAIPDSVKETQQP